ncbi:MAG: AAA family ATPase [Planctomycetes bacterium]|nr:AAA family ATPase [Planctomycetota bacterium]
MTGRGTASGDTSSQMADIWSLSHIVKSGHKIAVSGKGGVGKTTFCAVLSHLFSQDGSEVLAIDADSDPNLAAALGIAAGAAPEPLIRMKDLIAERTGAQPGSMGQYFKLNPKVSDLPEKYCVEAGGVKLLSLGSIEGAGSGCACPEGAFLKALLAYTILQREEILLVDMAAGLEFMGRACVQGVDVLVVVVEPGSRSIETAVHIAQMGLQMGITHVGAFVNKVVDAGQVEEIRSRLGDIPVLGSFGYDRALQAADMERAAVVGASEELVVAVKKAKETMLELFF